MEDIVVIGNGVIGLTTAYCLARENYKVKVIARSSFDQTTSAVAAAFFYPYKAEPFDKVVNWMNVSMSQFRKLSLNHDSGVVWKDFNELIMPSGNIPWWHECVDSFRLEERIVELPIGARKCCHYRVPVIDSSIYLQYLHRSAIEMGVSFSIRDIKEINECFESNSLVVNCSGLGSRELFNDYDLHAARGQVVCVKLNEPHSALVDLTIDGRIAHVIPRVNDSVLGGTYEPDEYSLEPDSDVTNLIIENCKKSFPHIDELEHQNIIAVKSGLRPVRSKVRLEKEAFGTKWILHNYGHGGAGFTLSWGCAMEISKMAAEISS